MKSQRPYPINTEAPATEGPFITPAELRNRTGLSLDTIRRLARKGLMPLPVARNENGAPLFDLGDPQMAEWLRAIVGAGE